MSGIALTAEQRDLADAVTGLLGRHLPAGAVRAGLDGFAAGTLPAVWPRLAEQGLLSDLVPAWDPPGEGWVELAVVVEAAGRALLPGPFLPTVLTTAVLADAGHRPPADGPAACALGPGGLRASRTADGWRVDGSSEPVLALPGAAFALLCARAGDGTDVWFVARPGADAGLTVAAAEPVDLTRSLGRAVAEGLRVDAATGVRTARVRDLAAVLFAAESAGLALWCVDTALEYARVREQFGRPIGSFQAVKHRLARLWVRCGLIAATAWDAARAVADGPAQLGVAAAAAAVRGPADAREVALDCVTVLGGIGYTWEHDIHLYWRRAVALGQLLGTPAGWAAELAGRRRAAARTFDVELDEPELRRAAAEVVDRAAALPEPRRRRYLAEQGYVAPEYPPPYGIDAGPAQQLVIAQEFARAGIAAPDLRIGAFTLPTVLAFGTPGQRERFLPPALRGETVWCQLFSEPGAGSDLAALSTKAVRVPGGWRLTGQKVWTSRAHEADWGVCLARTDPDAPRHGGLSCFVVDLHTEGVEVRPLRQANGAYGFNEVFLTEVFVPDDCLIGEPGQGWVAARTTLANERVSIAGKVVDGWEALVARAGGRDDPATAVALGLLAADQHALHSLILRSVLLRLSGLRSGAESSVLKVAAAEHHRAVATAALDLLGPDGASASDASRDYLGVPARLIGGGTMEIQLNVIAERVLRLPREPRTEVTS
ncbi:acyl-CoA dehydrogenase family protein [Dactylosporangium sp. NPDC000555]|uniref:acyl-CoA dehydrogenase family protein n=1 Tax=Dactylosporangium sp. NPDC000555 TaxID=3154260 RepID=UPI00332DF2FE